MKQATNSTEVEAVLLVMASDPATVLRRARAMRRLGTFRMVPRAPIIIEDNYWDTPEGRLGRRHYALRLRQYGGRPWATLKGPGISRAGVSTRKRLEIEVPWQGKQVRKKLTPALSHLGIGHLSSLGRGRLPEHRGAMAKLGLTLTQSRKTRRQPRDVFVVGAGVKGPIAELAIDVVTYTIGPFSPRFSEVEIEARQGGTPRQIENFISLLADKLGHQLVPWAYPKLAIGHALQVLATKDKLKSMMGRHGWLKKEAFAEIERVLSRSSAW